MIFRTWKNAPVSIIGSVSLLIAFAAGQVSASDHERGNVNIVRWAKGTLEYRTLSDGTVTGSEQWHLTVHPDGTRTLVARNRLDVAGYQRHVIHRVAASFRPLETTAVYWVKGEWRGTGLFIVEDDTLEAFVQTPDGLIRQSRSVPEHFSFIPHPLQTNAWHTWYYDKSRGGVQTINVYDMDAGAQAVSSMLGKLNSSTIEFVGEETITVPAGKFRVDHFRFGDAVDIYLTGQDAILVRFIWKPADRDYLLTTLQIG